MPQQALEGGFSDAPIQSAQAFRAIMQVMARPGEITEVSGATPPAPLSIAAGVILLTLCDPETPVFLAPHFGSKDIRDWITFHTGAPLVPAEKAQFAIGRWDDLDHLQFQIGTPEYPDRSATLIVDLDALEPAGKTLQGPGIKTSADLSLPDSPVFGRNAKLFPLGLDFIFTHENRVAAAPRTTRVS